MDCLRNLGMNTEQEKRLKYLRLEFAHIISERKRQSMILSENLNRLQHLLADMTELHVCVLEQMSVTGELIAAVNEQYELSPG